MTFLTIVLPAHNEELRITQAIHDLVNEFSDKCYSGVDIQIMVVENGSADNTAAVASQAALHYLRDNNLYFTLETSPPGKGAAVRHGMKTAKGKYILVTDVDLSTPISEFAKLFNGLLDRQADIAIGSRRLPGSFVMGLTPGRRFTSWGFSLLSGLVAPGIKDTQCGFKLFKRQAARNIADKITIDGFAYDVELLLVARKLNYKVIELPVIWVNDDRSTVRIIKDSARMAADIFKIYSRRDTYNRVS